MVGQGTCKLLWTAGHQDATTHEVLLPHRAAADSAPAAPVPSSLPGLPRSPGSGRRGRALRGLLVWARAAGRRALSSLRPPPRRRGRLSGPGGDALWDYHGGRPPLGALLLPGIKNGELGWRDVLLGRISGIPIPAFALDADLVTAAPTAFHRRWMRGFDLAEDVARLLARRLERPFARTLRKAWVTRRQAGRTESERRRLPGKSIRPLRGADLEGRTVLLVDDVWTTGTTLLRSAQALQAAGAKEVRILTLFRAV